MLFCMDERIKVKEMCPKYGVDDISRELENRWSNVDPTIKSKFEVMAENDKGRYERVSIDFMIFNSFSHLDHLHNSCSFKSILNSDININCRLPNFH